MVIDALFNFIYFILNGFISILPSGGALPTDFVNGVSFFIIHVEAWDKIVPLTTMLTLISLVLGIEVSILIWRFSQWIIRTIRGG